MKQRSFASVGLSGLNLAANGRSTRKAKFLIEMNALVPRSALCALIEPHYPNAGNGRPSIGLQRMLCIHFLLLWFNLADEACEEALYDTRLFREFAWYNGFASAPGSGAASRRSCAPDTPPSRSLAYSLACTPTPRAQSLA